MDVDILDPLNMQSCNFPVPGDTDTNKKKVVICGQVPEPERRSRSVIFASPGLRGRGIHIPHFPFMKGNEISSSDHDQLLLVVRDICLQLIINN